MNLAAEVAARIRPPLDADRVARVVGAAVAAATKVGDRRRGRQPASDPSSDITVECILARLLRFEGARLRWASANNLEALVRESIRRERSARRNGFDIEGIELAVEEVLKGPDGSALQGQAWQRVMAMAHGPMLRYLRVAKNADERVAEVAMRNLYDRLHRTQPLEQGERNDVDAVHFGPLRSFSAWLAADPESTENRNNERDIADYLRIVAKWCLLDAHKEIENETPLDYVSNLTSRAGGRAYSTGHLDVRTAIDRVICGPPGCPVQLRLHTDERDEVLRGSISRTRDPDQEPLSREAALRARMDDAAERYSETRWSSRELDAVVWSASGVTDEEVGRRLSMKRETARRLTKAAWAKLGGPT